MLIKTCLSVLLFLTLFLMPRKSVAQSETRPMALQEEASFIDEELQKRLDSIVPSLMKRENIDLWIITAREYNEDPVIRTMLPATWFAARRRTILVFWQNGEIVERYAVARYDIGQFFKKIWNPDEQPDQIQCLVDFINEKNPQKIALNFSDTYGQADGITHSEYEAILNKLPNEYKTKLVSAERLAVGWLETRTANEVKMMKKLARDGHSLIKAGFSANVVKPGVTTTEDIQWWFREEIRRMGYQTWFQPTVSVQRAQAPEHEGDFSSKPKGEIVQKGDLLHVDIGVSFARLHTDQQQHAYVLKDGETDVPQGLKDALKQGNRLQDLLTVSFQTGRTGNEILRITREKALAEKLKPSVYTHPLGFYGHGAGPTIGMWDNQGDTKGAGDYPLFENTGYSIELNVTVLVPEWNKEIRIMLEENAFFDGNKVSYYDGRQEKFILID